MPETGDQVQTVILRIDRAAVPYRGAWLKRVRVVESAVMPRICTRCGERGMAPQEFFLPEAWGLRKRPMLKILVVLLAGAAVLRLIAGRLPELLQYLLWGAAYVAWLAAAVAMVPRPYAVSYYLCGACGESFRRRKFAMNAVLAVSAIGFLGLFTLIGLDAYKVLSITDAFFTRVFWTAEISLAAGIVAFIVLFSKTTKFPLVAMGWLPDESGIVVRFLRVP